MSGIATAVVGSAVIGGVVASKSADKAAKAQIQAGEAASDAQLQATQLGIEEQQRQFDAIQELLKPYVDAGTGAIAGQEALLGLAGADEQAAAIAALEASPQFESIVQQGEEALLQNASATGGLRGGNLQGALAQFRPQILSQLIESQFGKLGSVAGLGQASAAGQAAAGQQTASAISSLLGQQGQALASQAIGQGQALAGSALAKGQAISGVTDSIGQLATLKALKVF